ncbi:MAG: nitroreductase family protein [Anaerolineales bacterium]|nr:nitroreductase family protein [Anaerolineales bacterium]
MSDLLLKTIKTRRVIREMSDRPVEGTQLEKILEAGRWAPAAGNQRTNRFVVIQDPLTLRLIRMFSPGMFQQPQAVILLCIDWDVVEANQFAALDRSPYIDLGATMQTMMLAAHAIGLGSGPATSFSKEAVRIILNLPPNLTPEIIVCIGYAAPPGKSQLPMRPKKKVTWQSLTDWERFEG